MGTVGGGVWRIDPVTHRTVAVVDHDDVGFGLTAGAGSVWVTGYCRGTVSRIDPTTNEVVAVVETGYAPKWLAVAGGDVWVGVAGERAFDFPDCQ